VKLSRVFLISISVVLVSSLSGCKYNRVKTAQAAKTELIGMSKTELLSCAGVPDKAARSNGVEFLSYRSGGETSYSANTIYGYNTTTFINSNYRFCDITITLENDRVQSVKYSGKTGGLFTPGEQCAYVLENCVTGEDHNLLNKNPKKIESSDIKIKVPSNVHIPDFVPFTATFNNPAKVDNLISVMADGKLAYMVLPYDGVEITSFGGRVRASRLQSKINVTVNKFNSSSKTTGEILDEKNSYYSSQSKASIPSIVDNSLIFTEKFSKNKLSVKFDNQLGKGVAMKFNLDTSKGRIQVLVGHGASGLNEKQDLSGFFSIKGNFDDASVSLVEMKEPLLKTKKIPDTMELSWDEKRTYKISPGDYIVTNSGYKYDYKKIKLNDLKLDNGDVLYSNNGKKKVAFDSMRREQLDSSKNSIHK
jgi:hypothetical protein